MPRRPLTDPTAVVARRGGAWFIDAVLIGLAGAVPALLLADAYALDRPDNGLDLETHDNEVAIFLRDTVIVLKKLELAITAGALVAALLLFLVLLPGRRGWSPGHLAADLRIVRRDGSRIGVGRAFVRSLGWFLDLLPGLPLVGYLATRLTRRHQRIGDLLARTYVVDKRADRRPVDERMGQDDVVPEVLDAEPVVDEPVPVVVEDEPPVVEGPESEGDPTPQPAAAAPMPAAPPEGVPPDQPIWDRRNKRYVLWHSRAGRWLTHTEAGWAPFEQPPGSDASPER